MGVEIWLGKRLKPLRVGPISRGLKHPSPAGHKSQPSLGLRQLSDLIHSRLVGGGGGGAEEI